MTGTAARALLAMLSLVLRALGRRGALAAGRLLGRTAWLTARRRRKLALDNLRQALGGEMGEGERRRVVVRSFEHLGMNAAEFFFLPAMDAEAVERIMVFEGEERLARALGMGRGVLLLSVHMGNWDLLGAALALKGYPLALITKVSRSEAVNELWMGYREEAGIRILRGRGTMRESLRHLGEGGIVGFVLDQNARRSEGVFVPFFGRPACTLKSLAILARRTGSPVVPAHTWREGDGHRVLIEPPMAHEPLPDVDEDVLSRTARYVQWTEGVIKAHPEQWPWLHDRWKTRPRENP